MADLPVRTPQTAPVPQAYEMALLAIVALVFIWSGISPHDRFTWVMEVFPVILGIPLAGVSILAFVLPHWSIPSLPSCDHPDGRWEIHLCGSAIRVLD